MKRVVFVILLLLNFAGVLNGQQNIVLLSEYTSDEIYFPLGISVDANRFIYILDREEQSIKVFDDKGKSINTIGRKGKGPSEFIGLSKISINENNELLAYDCIQNKIVFYNSEKKFQKEIKVDFEIEKIQFNNENLLIEKRIEERIEPEKGDLYQLDLVDRKLNIIRKVFNKRIVTGKLITQPRSIKVPFAFLSKQNWDYKNRKWISGKNDEKTLYISNLYNKETQKIEFDIISQKVTELNKSNYFKTKVMVTNDGQFKTPDFIKKGTKFPKYLPYYSAVKLINEKKVILKDYLNKNRFYSIGIVNNKIVEYEIPTNQEVLFTEFFDDMVITLELNEEDQYVIRKYKYNI